MIEKSEKKEKRSKKKCALCSICSIIPAIILSPVIFALAQIDSGTISGRRAELESELLELEKQIEGHRKSIAEKQKESTTFERDINILNSKIEKAKLEIKARDLTISRLNTAIGEKSRIIGGLVNKIEEEKMSLAELLRQLNESDSNSVIEILFAYDNLSGFFIDVDSFYTVQESIQKSFAEIRTTKTGMEEERDELQNRKNEEMELKSLQVLEKKRIEENENEKKQLLKITKGKEKEYQKLLTARQKDAASIRSQLFLLLGSPSIPFEKALEYANVAYKKTGVRPAFILGVIAEESNLGANVGTGNWKEDLSHPRCASQREAFTKITRELGLDPDLMPVSRRAWYGYCGGAMGPAQFMPTTWNLYKDIIAEKTGNNPPSPWNPLDAFTASALLLKDNGATKNGHDGEITAALKYLAGSNWKKPSYRFYGDDVMALAAKYQEQIDILEKS